MKNSIFSTLGHFPHCSHYRQDSIQFESLKRYVESPAVEDLSTQAFSFQQKVADCQTLYLAYGGRHHEAIEREMRALGHATFHRRALYARNDRGRHLAGWPERFGWMGGIENGELRIENEERLRPATPGPASANSQFSILTSQFEAWLRKVSPEFTWDWKYQQYIYEKLKRLTDGLCKRLMIFMPPRHGKSELVTQRYAAWRLKRDPKMRVVVASYNQKLANRFSRGIKRILHHDSALSREAAAERSPTCSEAESGVAVNIKNPETAERATSSVHHDASTCPECIAKADGGYLNGKAELFRSANFRRVNTESEWETPEGGGVRAVGVGAGITGFGADLVIIDDPVKGHAQAESATMRENVWEWFNSDIYTRLEPDGAIILIQTRWHSDDLAGRLLREMHDDEDAEQWEVISLPALAESGIESGELRIENEELLLSPTGTNNIAQGKAEGCNPGFCRTQHADPEGVEQQTPMIAPFQGAHPASPFPGVTLASLIHPRLLNLSPSATGCDPLARGPGEALCPERFDAEKLERIKKKLGTYAFSALYQQRPVPAEGGFFKRHWFKTIDHPPPNVRWKRGYDLGLSARADADFTATARVGFDHDGKMYIDRVVRKRMEYPEQKRTILRLIAKENDTEHLIEESANGTAVIQDLRRDRNLLGRRFRGVRVTKSKTARALAWNALAEEGRVSLIRGPWNSEFLAEACSFPLGTHDDQIDAVSLAVEGHGARRKALIFFD